MISRPPSLKMKLSDVRVLSGVVTRFKYARAGNMTWVLPSGTSNRKTSLDIWPGTTANSSTNSSKTMVVPFGALGITKIAISMPPFAGGLKLAPVEHNHSDSIVSGAGKHDGLANHLTV